MTGLDFLPAFPPVPGELTMAGAVLLAGLASGELFRRVLRLPRITGYLLAGIMLGPGALGVIGSDLLNGVRVVLDIAVGLILYELGSRLDLGWLRRNPWLLATSVAESALAFLFVFAALLWLDIGLLLAAVAAAIGMGTSPAVLLMVVHEQRAEGPLTEQAVNLTALNNAFAVVVVTMLLAYLHLEYQGGVVVLLLHPIYLLLGSVALGYVASTVTLWLAGWIGKREVLQFALLVAMILLAVGTAAALELSLLLTLLAFGVFARNRDRNHRLLPVEFGPTAQFFFIGLFVLTGAYLEWDELAVAGWAGLVYALVRLLGKLVGLLAFAPLSGLRLRKAALLGLALTPMSAVAVLLVDFTRGVYPAFGVELSAIVLAAVLVLSLVGPAATQIALRLAGEARDESGVR
jgi:Kef-type K+ transport system membrane component KefB